MKKIKVIISTFLLLFVGVFMLASCGNKSGVTEEDVQITLDSRTSKSITLKVAFNSQNENLKSGTSKVHIKAYLVDGDSETYKSDNDVNFGTGITTTQFTSLTASSTYRFRVYITYSGTDYEIYKDEKKITYKTTSTTPTLEDAVKINSIDDFNNMKSDPTAYYLLEANLDFDGATLTQKFSDSTPFTGVFDGNGHTIKNFVLYNTKFSGLFEYTSGATIKNLNVENASIGIQSSFSISQTNVGALVGYGHRTLIQDCNVKDVQIKVTPSSYNSSKVCAGAVIGYGEVVTIENVNLANSTVAIDSGKAFVFVGLFAGSLVGNGLKDGVTANNCFAEGAVNVYNNYQTTAEGETVIGGFVGNATNQGVIKNSFTNVDIKVTKYVTSTTSNFDKFNLYVGGFVGTQATGVVGGMNFEKCVSVNSIKVYAGQLTGTEEAEPDFSANKLTLGELDSKGYYAYVGGFLGSTNTSACEGIEGCAVVFKDNTTPLYINAKKVLVTETTEEGAEGEEPTTTTTETQLVFDGVFAGFVQRASDVRSCFTSLDDGATYVSFTSAIQNAITKALETKAE